jgi:hypothetical protein
MTRKMALTLTSCDGSQQQMKRDDRPCVTPSGEMPSDRDNSPTMNFFQRPLGPLLLDATIPNQTTGRRRVRAIMLQWRKDPFPSRPTGFSGRPGLRLRNYAYVLGAASRELGEKGRFVDLFSSVIQASLIPPVTILAETRRCLLILKATRTLITYRQ